MKVTRYFESLSNPKDTMFVLINDQYRFTGRGTNWAKFREHLIKVMKQTISEELAEEFEKETENWEATDST